MARKAQPPPRRRNSRGHGERLREEIIAKLDEAGKTFHVLVLKTRMTIPYTSVFVRLDCGYWTEEQEKKLREKMGAR